MIAYLFHMVHWSLIIRSGMAAQQSFLSSMSKLSSLKLWVCAYFAWIGALLFYKINCYAAIHGRIWMNNVPNEIKIFMLSSTEISFVIYFFILRNLQSNPGFLFFFNSHCMFLYQQNTNIEKNYFASEQSKRALNFFLIFTIQNCCFYSIFLLVLQISFYHFYNIKFFANLYVPKTDAGLIIIHMKSPFSKGIRPIKLSSENDPWYLNVSDCMRCNITKPSPKKPPCPRNVKPLYVHWKSIQNIVRNSL